MKCFLCPMKIFNILLFCVLCAFPHISSGQRTYPQKGDKLILVKTFTESDSLNFQNFSKYLLSKGYSFEERDFSLMYLQTDLKTSMNNKGKPSAVRHKLLVSFSNGNEIHVRIKMEIPTFTMTLTLTDWEYTEGMFNESNFFYWQWFYNVKPLLESYLDKSGIYYQ